MLPPSLPAPYLLHGDSEWLGPPGTTPNQGEEYKDSEESPEGDFYYPFPLDWMEPEDYYTEIIKDKPNKITLFKRILNTSTKKSTNDLALDFNNDDHWELIIEIDVITVLIVHTELVIHRDISPWGEQHQWIDQYQYYKKV